MILRDIYLTIFTADICDTTKSDIDHLDLDVGLSNERYKKIASSQISFLFHCLCSVILKAISAEQLKRF